ncbi:hypothetical protein PHYSODRAFT_294532 [Phytophthora sojae]|uniref:Uncharacterized protein n=1 Tax=Phytophthora sojae (strain P6497) TaxID=1094619 RepID=G4YQ08_PHYSP|nr:hypothetical protein PHYSODRAFT_294532 [Phytophthora sojae]EGZ29323.1 hypothetical protein PHYSODRAFT_294532 [Phytophthora sojae]|eukprot:XP_009516598.1 hypothetical protein PHYSODRAFT_294532 [Phytophthora sojae]
MKKRRRKQATQEQVHSSSDRPKCGNVIVVDDNNETDSATSRGPSTNNHQGSTEPPRNMRTPVEQYESALKARGSQAQLLKDLDLSLLRSVAEIAFCQVTLTASSRRNGNSLQDETHHELQRYARRIEVAKSRLSVSIADIAGKQSESPTSADSGIDIPSLPRQPSIDAGH